MESPFCVLSGVSMGGATSTAESDDCGLAAVAAGWLMLALSRVAYAAAWGEGFGTEPRIALGAAALAVWALVVALRDQPYPRSATKPVRARRLDVVLASTSRATRT